jgi:hypothetical protein
MRAKVDPGVVQRARPEHLHRLATEPVRDLAGAADYDRVGLPVVVVADPGDSARRTGQDRPAEEYRHRGRQRGHVRREQARDREPRPGRACCRRGLLPGARHRTAGRPKSRGSTCCSRGSAPSPPVVGPDDAMGPGLPPLPPRTRRSTHRASSRQRRDWWSGRSVGWRRSATARTRHSWSRPPVARQLVAGGRRRERGDLVAHRPASSRRSPEGHRSATPPSP